MGNELYLASEKCSCWAICVAMTVEGGGVDVQGCLQERYEQSLGSLEGIPGDAVCEVVTC